MADRIDIGVDKNVPEVDAAAARKNKVSSLLLDDIPKSPDDAVAQAKRALMLNWINVEPLLAAYEDDEGNTFLFYLSEALKKNVVLLFFCDFTLLPCRRSLDYIIEWQNRYGTAGLMTILVQSPLFEFAKDRLNIEAVVKDLRIGFPVVVDSDFGIWKSVENRYWPRRILLSPKGEVFHDVVGEKEYQDFELSIQHLLRKLSPGLSCPPLLNLIHESDKPDYVEPQTTPNLFLGSSRNRQLANLPENFVEGTDVLFEENGAGPSVLDVPYLTGMWHLGKECISGYQVQYNKPSPYRGEMKITISFTGTDAYVVLGNRPKTIGDMPQIAKVGIYLNKKPISEDGFGSDVFYNETHRPVISVRVPKLFHVASRLDHKTHELTLQLESDSNDTIEVYAMFFESKAPREVE